MKKVQYFHEALVMCFDDFRSSTFDLKASEFRIHDAQTIKNLTNLKRYKLQKKTERKMLNKKTQDC